MKLRVTKAMMSAVQAKLSIAGNKARMLKLSPAQRSASASIAGKASNLKRWGGTAETRRLRDARIFWDWPSGLTRKELAEKNETSLGVVNFAIQTAKKAHSPEAWDSLLEARKKAQKGRAAKKVKP